MAEKKHERNYQGEETTCDDESDEEKKRRSSSGNDRIRMIPSSYILTYQSGFKSYRSYSYQQETFSVGDIATFDGKECQIHEILSKDGHHQIFLQRVQSVNGQWIPTSDSFEKIKASKIKEIKKLIAHSFSISTSTTLIETKPPKPSQSKPKPIDNLSVEDVCKWLETIGCSETKELFSLFNINGKELLNLTSDKLKEIGITDSDKRITIIRESLKLPITPSLPQPIIQQQQQQQSCPGIPLAITPKPVKLMDINFISPPQLHQPNTLKTTPPPPPKQSPSPYFRSSRPIENNPEQKKIEQVVICFGSDQSVVETVPDNLSLLKMFNGFEEFEADDIFQPADCVFGFLKYFFNKAFVKNRIPSTWQDFVLEIKKGIVNFTSLDQIDKELIRKGFSTPVKIPQQIKEWNTSFIGDITNWYYYETPNTFFLIGPRIVEDILSIQVFVHNSSNEELKTITLTFDSNECTDILSLHNVCEKLVDQEQLKSEDEVLGYYFGSSEEGSKFSDYDSNILVVENCEIHLTLVKNETEVEHPPEQDGIYLKGTEIPPALLYRQQAQIGLHLFERMVNKLGGKDEILRKFQKVEFYLVTAGYVSLLQQTRSRMTLFGLKSDASNTWISNSCYFSKKKSEEEPNNPKKKHNDKFYVKDLHQRIVDPKNSSTLFIIVYDEAHWGINETGVLNKMMNGCENEDQGIRNKLKDAHNLIQLLVSATPYNLLTKESRIPDENVVKWSDGIDSMKGRCDGIDIGFNYIGLFDYLIEMQRKGNQTPPIRSDSHFEEMAKAIVKEVSSEESENKKIVYLLTCDYILSICIAHLKENTNKTWNDIRKLASEMLKTKGAKQIFGQVVDYYHLNEIEMVQRRINAFPMTETDKIVCGLLNKEHPRMTVIRIMPGDDQEKEKSQSPLFFQNSIQSLIKALDMKFFVIGDYGATKLEEQVRKPQYRKLWVKMQACHCEFCECKQFQTNSDETDLKCSSCKHVHKPEYKSYEDLGEIGLLLVVVMKGRLGDTFPRTSFRTLDMRVTKRRSKNLVLSSLVQELGRLCHYSERKKPWNEIIGYDSPIALVSKNLEIILLNAKNGDINTLGLPLDKFAPAKNIDLLRETICFTCLTRGGYPMDHNNKDKWQRRFLLWAEPQQGKTKAFCFTMQLFLQLLNTQSGIEIEEPIIPKINRNQLEFFFPLWYFPHIDFYSCSLPPYNRVKQGKYHQIIRRQREIQFNSSCEDCSKFIAQIKRTEGPFCLDAIHKLHVLSNPNKQLQQREAINWDDFFHYTSTSNPLQLQVIKPRTIKVKPEIEEFFSCNSLETNQQKRGNGSSKIETFYFIWKTDDPIISPLVSITTSMRGIKFSIPEHFKPAFDFNTFKQSVKGKNEYRWVFIPSYRIHESEWVVQLTKPQKREEGGAAEEETISPAPEQCRLNYFNTYSETEDGRKKLIQIILVREEQFESYKSYWGANCVIVCLPLSIKYRSEVYNAEYPEYTPESGGIGYSRLFGQLLAYQLGIDFIHMWDDNVICCYELQKQNVDPPTLVNHRVRFSRLMHQLELIMQMNGEEICATNNHPNESLLTILNKHICKQNPVQSISDYAGFDRTNCGMIGTSRIGSRYSKEKVHPFKNTKVYSTFLLNVKLTVEKGALFPCKRMCEDIEFAYILEDHKIKSIKCQRFAHAKQFSSPHQQNNLPSTEELEKIFCYTLTSSNILKPCEIPSSELIRLSNIPIKSIGETTTENESFVIANPNEKWTYADFWKLISPTSQFSVFQIIIFLGSMKAEDSWKTICHPLLHSFEVRSNVKPNENVIKFKWEEDRGGALLISKKVNSPHSNNLTTGTPPIKIKASSFSTTPADYGIVPSVSTTITEENTPSTSIQTAPNVEPTREYERTKRKSQDGEKENPSKRQKTDHYPPEMINDLIELVEHPKTDTTALRTKLVEKWQPVWTNFSSVKISKWIYSYKIKNRGKR